jgi:outer membrane receptor protein involved in Fe transport
MDTQAPALNFPIGNLNGPSELDVESVELIPGASSALYGPNAFNGVLLINSKNPFEYQGLSATAKLGFNHIGNNADFDGPAPLWEGSIRYAKAFNNKFAFKVNLSYMRAKDWHGTYTTDREIARTPAGFGFNPGSDKLNFMGDEAAINLSIFRLSSAWNTFAGTSTTYYNNIFEPGLTARDYAAAGDLPSHIVSVSPYAESDLIDYGAENLKASAGIFYRINDKLELSGLFSGGYGTSIYTGAQRYSLSNFGINQYRIQLRGDNFYLRGYATMENSGDSYITEFLAKRVNDIAVGQANPLFSDVSGYLATYGALYLRYLYDQGLMPGEFQTLSDAQKLAIQQDAHIYARNIVDNGGLIESTQYRPMHLSPGSPEFIAAKEEAMTGTVPEGPRFNDKTNLYHGEFQYDFKNQISFIELQAGGSFRLYDLNSNGTIFDDKDESVIITEFGGYVQAGKWLAGRRIKLSGSARYDKNVNFKGRINPRISAVVKASDSHVFRLSYQTGFRLPTTQGQHIDLNVISYRLIGGLPRYADKYDIVRTSSTGQPLSFEGFSVEAFRNEVFNNGAVITPQAIARLVPYSSFDPVKPERINSAEIGYRGVINNNFMIDMAYYYNIYNDFETQVRIVAASELPDGSPNYATILNGTAFAIDNGIITGNTCQIYTNVSSQVTAQGAVAGLTYKFPGGFSLDGNYNWNVLQNVPDGFLSMYNTPEHKFNIGISNYSLTDNFGFNITWRWQDEFLWESAFTIPANGFVPEYNTIDAQASYKLRSLKSVLRIGASNLINKKYIQSLGGPNIGGLYYLSLTFDEFMK